MQSVSSPPNRSPGIARFGCGLILLTVGLSAGCSRFGLQNDKLGLAPIPKTEQKAPQARGNTEPFALTNEGARIEQRLLDRRRSTWITE